jgi:hypothetical protein
VKIGAWGRYKLDTRLLVVATGPEEDEDPDERKEKPDKRRFSSFSVLFDSSGCCSWYPL